MIYNYRSLSFISVFSLKFILQLVCSIHFNLLYYIRWRFFLVFHIINKSVFLALRVESQVSHCIISRGDSFLDNWMKFCYYLHNGLKFIWNLLRSTIDKERWSRPNLIYISYAYYCIIIIYLFISSNLRTIVVQQVPAYYTYVHRL